VVLAGAYFRRAARASHREGTLRLHYVQKRSATSDTSSRRHADAYTLTLTLEERAIPTLKLRCVPRPTSPFIPCITRIREGRCVRSVGAR